MAEPGARERYENRLTPEAKARIVTASKQSWADPEIRAKRLATAAITNQDPAVRAKRSAAKKLYWEQRRLLKQNNFENKNEDKT